MALQRLAAEARRATISARRHLTDFEAVLRSLSEAGVEFVVVGGLAATIHGSARLTQDIDVVYSRSSANIERLVAVLGPHAPYLRGAPPGLPFDWSAATVERGLNFTLTTAIGDIDLLGEITGAGDYDALVPHTVDVDIFGCRCRCLTFHGSSAPSAPRDGRRIWTRWPSWKRCWRSAVAHRTGERGSERSERRGGLHMKHDRIGHLARIGDEIVG